VEDMMKRSFTEFHNQKSLSSLSLDYKLKKYKNLLSFLESSAEDKSMLDWFMNLVEPFEKCQLILKNQIDLYFSSPIAPLSESKPVSVGRIVFCQTNYYSWPTIGVIIQSDNKNSDINSLKVLQRVSTVEKLFIWVLALDLTYEGDIHIPQNITKLHEGRFEGYIISLIPVSKIGAFLSCSLPVNTVVNLFIDPIVSSLKGLLSQQIDQGLLIFDDNSNKKLSPFDMPKCLDSKKLEVKGPQNELCENFEKSFSILSQSFPNLFIGYDSLHKIRRTQAKIDLILHFQSDTSMVYQHVFNFLFCSYFLLLLLLGIVS
jgi:hypothetical protein